MIGRTRKPTSTTKCVCAVMHTENGGVLPQARAERVSQGPASAEFDSLGHSFFRTFRPAKVVDAFDNNRMTFAAT